MSLQLIPGAISEMLATVSDTKTLSLADRYGLMAAILDENLPEEDRYCINRLLRSTLRGKISLGQEFSTLA